MPRRGSRYDDEDDVSTSFGFSFDDEDDVGDLEHESSGEFVGDTSLAVGSDDEDEPAANTAWRRPLWSLAGVILTVVLVFALIIDRNPTILSERDRQPTAPVFPPSGLSYCSGVDDKDRARIEWAVTEMRRVDEGDALFGRLLDLGLCVDTEDLPYNAGYTPLRSDGRTWTVDKIVLDRDLVSRLNPDELAAILVHEATHADRAARGVNCYQTQNCTFLANGIPVEEEVAAHAAEASFWIALHGPTRTRTSASWTGGWGAAWENELAGAAQEGPDALREFVIEARSDPREGKGIKP